jgi:hypothetical protein
MPGRAVRASAAVVLAGVATLAVTGCSHGPSTADRSAATALPTPPKSRAVPGRELEQQVRQLLAARAVSVDEDLHVGQQEQEVRLTWAAHGSVVDASSLPIGTSSRKGTEVFRSPRTLLQRPAGVGSSCWSPGGEAAARYDRPAAQEIAVLRSARATSGNGDLLKGSVSAGALLAIIGSDAQLRSRGLTAPAGARVPATFGTADAALEITTDWRDLVRATGSSSRSPGTWLLQFRQFGGAGPTAPTADMMCP